MTNLITHLIFKISKGQAVDGKRETKGRGYEDRLAAKRDLRLPQELTKLDKFACSILDDIGYVQHDRDEMEILFTFLAERKSVMLTTNLVFSERNMIDCIPIYNGRRCEEKHLFESALIFPGYTKHEACVKPGK